ncbi:hypothetical protein OM076_35910 [Solirubrobacter ginsenosidimutans]|uniref:Uncharacterized protein n=1 Tax=Solirubrobacter ginsenosidimutans TaxID=490573 RepID=A0A9X3MZN6_9ACTN|nr:hypothetical protein [Solirubrobacter ginsenosidimutans]MDA0165709.1 hypothetical protein [Solirubrobacter ginsenosidimutans]
MHRLTRLAYSSLRSSSATLAVSAAHPAAERFCGLIRDDGARIGIVVQRGKVPCSLGACSTVLLVSQERRAASGPFERPSVTRSAYRATPVSLWEGDSPRMAVTWAASSHA